MKWPRNIKELKFIAGVDAAFSEGSIIGIACLFKYPELIPLEETHAITKVSFPYIPGFLSFREGPAAIKAINNLKIKPDIVLFDGQGIAHPEGIGIATHIGVLMMLCLNAQINTDYLSP